MDALPHSEDPLVGAHLGDRYLITGLLARGGMGLVYEGRHEQLGRAVAIKVLGPDMGSDPAIVERFLREARIASSFGHGNIVDVSDLGTLQDGRPYLVMPRIVGVDLAVVLAREGPMSPRRVAKLLCGVAAALDLVHAKGLAHRDVKPENLMYVVRADGSESVMLTDFGIAGLIAAKQARLTADGMICGTPAYIAPELVSTGEFDGRADVYALSAVAFELMTGRVPFDGHPGLVMAAKVQTAAPSLSAVAKRRFGRAVEDVVARGLARAPEDRFQRAGAFVAALAEAAQKEEAGCAHVHASRRRALANPNKVLRPRAFATKPIVALGLMSSVLVASWFLPHGGVSERSHSRPPEAVLSAVVMPPPKASVTGDERLPDLGTAPAPAAVVHAEVESDSKDAGTVAAAAPMRRARVHVAAPQPLPLPSAAAPAFSADELSRKANQELLHGRLVSALELFERAVERDSRSEPAYRGLGVVNERIGRRAEAMRAFRRALELEPHGPHVAALRARLERLEAIR